MDQEDPMYWQRGRTVSAIEPNSRVSNRRGQLDQQQHCRQSMMKPTLQCSSNSKLDKMDYEEKLVRYKLLLERVKAFLTIKFIF